jgi:hypothetical protein
MNQSKDYDHVALEDYASVAGPDWPSYDIFCQHTHVPDWVYAEIDRMLVRPVQFEHESFCVLPFYAREFWLGAVDQSQSFCCLVPDATDRESVKQDMLAGRRPQSCEACWALEDQGLVSDRLIKNRQIDSDQLDQIQQLLSGQSTISPILHYKIDSNNTCNGTCVVCDSTYSSSWAQLERKNNIVPPPSRSLTTTELDAQIDYAKALTVGFRGGEPMLSDRTWHVLKRLLEAQNTRCAVTFTTNGTIPLTAEQQHLIAQFPKAAFHFSIDGVGPVFEYVRYPLQWQDLVENLTYCREQGIPVTASYTISNLNILYHAQTRAWFENQGIEYSLNPVRSPEYFKPSSLPKAVKDQILQQQPDALTKFLLGSHDPQDDANYDLFQQRIAKQDQWKGIRMQDYLPELVALLG